MEPQNENSNIEGTIQKKEEICKIQKEKAILGKGAFGTVYLGTKINSDGKKEKVALKEIPKQLNDEESQRAIQNEIDICQKLDNTNIVKMIKIEKNIDDKTYLVYELCNGGDLRRYMDYFKIFDEELIQIIVIKMVNALFELHDKNVVHHDIKPENILIQLFPEEEMTPEIEKKINDIKEATSKKHKQQNNQNNNNANQNKQNTNNTYQNNQNNNIINLNNQKNINAYQNNNNRLCQNNSYLMNNNMNPITYNTNMNYNFQTNYNQVCPPMPYNQFNNNNPNNNFIWNNNINGNYYHPNNLNSNFNNFRNNNMNKLDIQSLLMMKSKSNDYLNNNNAYNLNNMNYNTENKSNNNNQNNQNNNNIEKPIDKSEILKVLKNSQFKLSDFGLSKIKSEKNKKDGKAKDEGNRCGSPLYMSPELFLLGTSENTLESQKVDIWALGILAFEMFFGRRPFEAYSLEELAKLYKKREYYLDLKGEKNNKISKEFIEFLNLCLQERSIERADVYCLQNTDFFNMDYNCLEKLDKNELSSSLGFPERDEQNNILLRIDEKYFEQKQEENKQ